MFKTFWERFKAWIKDIPWFVPVAGAFLSVVFVHFLVVGRLLWTDYPAAALFGIVVSVFVYKAAKRVRS